MSSLILDAETVLGGLRSFVREEFEAQRARFARQQAKMRQERVDDGTCLDGLRFLRQDEAGRAVFAHQGNDSRLREGDFVMLRRAEDDDSIDAVLFREEAGEIWLAPQSRFKTDTFEDVEGWFIDEAFVDLESQFIDALNRVPTTRIGQECILPLLMGKEEQALDMEEYNGAMEDLEGASTAWEDAQKEAIAGCLATERCYLVQGPPGTGKTRVLAQVVRRLVARGERVLVTAFTHRAIDNAISAIAAEIDDRERVARFCAAQHSRSEGFDRHEYFAESPLASLSDGGWVAAATPFALRKRLPGVEFSTIVFDESGQMTTALAIMAMLAGPKYLFFGDQRQLGPVVMSRPRREAENIGVFHALRSRSEECTMLDVTYRLNDTLTVWPSEKFYHGALSSAPSAAFRRLAFAASAAESKWVKQALDPASPLVWIDSDAEQSRTTNEHEYAHAAELLRALIHGGVPMEDIAVVTPYRRQARMIRRRLETLVPEVSWRACVIDTVERMQGQEREVIIVSLCAADPVFIQTQAEFLFDPRRLNVAATRARTKLILFASPTLLHTSLDDSDLEEEQALLASLRAASTMISL